MKKLFTILIVLFPILYIYNTGIATLTVADILLILIIPFLICDTYKKNKKIKYSKILICIVGLFILQLVIYMLCEISTMASIMTTIRITLYYFVCAIFVKNYFDLDYGINFYEKVAFIAAIFYLFQYLMLNMFNVFVPGTIPGLDTSVNTYNEIMSSYSWTSSAYARPRSFFAEPSHYAVYVSLALAIMLLIDKKKKPYKIVVIVLSMLFSGSGMAIALCAVILLIFFIKNIKSFSKKTLNTIFAVCMLLVLIFPYYSQTESFQIFYNRTFVEKDSTEGRFGNFMDAFTLNKKTYEVLFGEGIYKIEDTEDQDYITSIPRIYTYFGMVGMIIFVAISIRNFLKLKGIHLLAWTILFIISFASEIIFHNLMLVFVPYIIADNGGKINE